MTARRLAWSVWGVTIAFLVAWPFLSEAGSAEKVDVVGYALEPLAILGFATVGALITSRQPDNRLGLMLAWIGFFGAAGLAVGSYARWGIDGGASLPAEQAAAWFNRAGSAVMLAPIPLIFLLFPDGQGFDPQATGYGTGLQGMADRLDAIGGTFTVSSAPGAGTAVTGRIPVRDREMRPE